MPTVFRPAQTGEQAVYRRIAARCEMAQRPLHHPVLDDRLHLGLCDAGRGRGARASGAVRNLRFLFRQFLAPHAKALDDSDRRQVEPRHGVQYQIARDQAAQLALVIGVPSTSKATKSMASQSRSAISAATLTAG